MANLPHFFDFFLEESREGEWVLAADELVSLPDLLQLLISTNEKVNGLSGECEGGDIGKEEEEDRGKGQQFPPS